MVIYQGGIRKTSPKKQTKINEGGGIGEGMRFKVPWPFFNSCHRNLGSIDALGDRFVGLIATHYIFYIV